MKASAKLTIPRMFSDATGSVDLIRQKSPSWSKNMLPPPRRSPWALPWKLDSVSLSVSRLGGSVFKTLLLKAASRVCVWSRAFSGRRRGDPCASGGGECNWRQYRRAGSRERGYFGCPVWSILYCIDL